MGTEIAETSLTSLRSIVENVISKGASVEVVEKLLALQERYEANQAKRAFEAALSEMRKDLPEIIKNKTVDFTSNRGRTYYHYEDLSSVVDSLSPVMAEHGFSFRWRTRSDPKQVYVTCILSHSEGHTEETELSCGHDNTGNKNEIQAIGSAVTYLQRYTLKAALGIAASHDDDAQSAGRNEYGARPQDDPGKQERPPQEPAIKTERAAFGAELLAYCNNDKKRSEETLFSLTGKKSFASLTNDEAKVGRESLKALMAQKDDNIPLDFGAKKDDDDKRAT